MSVDLALRRLAPLIPSAVARWRRTLSLIDADTKNLLDRHILITAAARLGPNWQDQLQLPPPAEECAAGPFRLGTTEYPGVSHPFGLSPGELLQGLGIFGRSGAGKTNVAFLLLDQLERSGVPYIFFDWKKTARHRIGTSTKPIHLLTPGRSLAPITFNPLIPPPGMELGAYLTQVVDALAASYTLGDGAKSLLQDALQRAYSTKSTKWPVLADLIQDLEARVTKGRASGWMATAMRALSALHLTDPLDSTTDQEAMVADLTRRNTIIELDALNQNAKQFLVPLLLLWLFHHRMQLPQREELQLVIVIEEAHHLLYRQEQRYQETLINRMLRQYRELGIGIVVIDQHPHLISSAALGNLYATICLNLREPTDVIRAAQLSGLDSADRHHLGLLPVGTGVVKLQGRHPAPFLVKFKQARVRKGQVTDEVFRSLVSRPTRSASRTPHRRSPTNVRHVRVSDAPLPPDALRMLADTLDHPTDGVRARYARLGLSADRGGRAKAVLIQSGLLEAKRMRVARTRRLALRPTPGGRRLLKAASKPGPESLEHEFYKHLCAEELRSQGYEVIIEAPRVGGRVDLDARQDGRRVAVEIETGRSDVVRNVRNCLQAGYDQVLVVATSQAALGLVRTRLTGAGLLFPGRVELRLRTVTDRSQDR